MNWPSFQGLNRGETDFVWFCPPTVVVTFETSDRQVVDAAARPVAQQDAQTSKSQTSIQQWSFHPGWLG